MDAVGKSNVLWNFAIARPLAAFNFVLSDIGARSPAHHHLLPFWNHAIKGRKGYIMYDLVEAKRRKYALHANDKVPHAPQLSFMHFLDLAKDGFAWIATLDSKSKSRFIMVPERIAHDVKTWGEQRFYVGLVGYWLPYSDMSRKILYYCKDKKRGRLTKFIIDKHLYNAIGQHIKR